MFNAIIFDANDLPIGIHTYAEEPASYPDNERPATQAQADNFSQYRKDGTGLVQDLATVQSDQISILRDACKATIENGFTSSAVGSAMTYPSSITDQGNIDRAAISGGSLWCADASGNWSFEAHTLAEAQQVRSDMTAHIQAAQSKYSDLVIQVNSATTVSDVQAICW